MTTAHALPATVAPSPAPHPFIRAALDNLESLAPHLVAALDQRRAPRTHSVTTGLSCIGAWLEITETSPPPDTDSQPTPPVWIHCPTSGLSTAGISAPTHRALVVPLAHFGVVHLFPDRAPNLATALCAKFLDNPDARAAYARALDARGTAPKA
jgi:hypothetical protein